MSEMSRFVVVGMCGGLTAAYVCRLNLMTWTTAKLSVIAFHAAMLLYCAWQGIDAFTGRAVTTDRIGLIAAACWLAMSWHTWRDGLPDHVRINRHLNFPKLEG
jgi:CHASE2 domain-containing sensor protein